MEFSNKALAVLLLAAMVVSLGGTILSLNRLDVNTKTGYATSDVGNVTLTVAGSLSITLDSQDVINFGNCQPAGGGLNVTINSEGTANTSTICTAFTTGNFSIRNDGNSNALVNVTPDDVGAIHSGNFLDSTSGGSAIAIKTIPGGNTRDNGCVGTMISSYTNMTAVGGNYTVCSNLTYPGVISPTNDSFMAHIQIILPFDVPQGQQDVIMTFLAYNA